MGSSYTTPSNYGFTNTVWHCADVRSDAYAMSTRDIFGGAATVYDIYVQNDSATQIYVKIYDKRLEIKDGSVSTLKAPIMIFSVYQGTSYSIPFPSGYSFTNGVTVRAVQNPGTDGTTIPSGGVVIVTIMGR